MPLKDKQRRFVEEYLVDLNATQAAIRAGYSKKTAYSIGNENLNKPEISKAIGNAMKKRSERTEITADMVLAELAKIGFSNMQDYIQVSGGDAFVDLSELTREQAAAISEVTVEYLKDGRGDDARDIRKVKLKLSDKRSALVDIGKHLGMFVNKHEHSGAGGGPIEVAGDPDNSAHNLALKMFALVSEGQKEAAKQKADE